MGSRNSTTIPARPIAPARQTVGVAAVQGANVPCHGVVVKAIAPGQTIDVGVSSAVASGAGWPLSDGETLTFEVTNLNQLWFIASAAGQAIAYFPYRWV